MITPYYQPYWAPDYLEHHGVKNQKWGQRNGPPYPLDRGKDGRITQKQRKKKQGVIARLKANHQKKVKAKQRAAAKAEKAKQAKKDTEEKMSKEELREKLLKSTDPKFIASHMDMLDTKEIKERLDRINTEKQVKQLLKDDSKKKVDKGMEWVKNVKEIADTTSKAAIAYSNVLEATGKKEKLRQERESARDEANNRNKTAKKFMRLIDEYGENADAFRDIEINFDPKTGKMSFKSNRKF